MAMFISIWNNNLYEQLGVKYLYCFGMSMSLTSNIEGTSTYVAKQKSMKSKSPTSYIDSTQAPYFNCNAQ